MGDAQPKRKSSGRALHAPRAWAVLLIVLAAGLALDLWTKHWSFENVADWPVRFDRAEMVAHPTLNFVPPHDPMVIVPRVLNFQLVQNRGAVFGIGADQRLFFIVFTLAALAAGLWIFAKRTGARAHLAHIGLGLILAGGLGNLHDRIAYAAVRDFIHAFPGWDMPFGWSWPGGSTELFPWVFNIADAMLLIGVVVLMWHINRADRKQRQAPAEAAEGASTTMPAN